jgi:hypothetical protein
VARTKAKADRRSHLAGPVCSRAESNALVAQFGRVICVASPVASFALVTESEARTFLDSNADAAHHAECLLAPTREAARILRKIALITETGADRVEAHLARVARRRESAKQQPRSANGFAEKREEQVGDVCPRPATDTGRARERVQERGSCSPSSDGVTDAS